MNKYIIIGPPRSGKSTYARQLREEGIPTYCTDPGSCVKNPETDVTYAPDVEWSECSDYVARKWMTMPAPWCIEGVGSVRALRKYLVNNMPSTLRDVTIVVFEHQLSEHVTKAGQSVMAKSINTIWNQIRPLVKTHVRKIVTPQRVPALRVNHNSEQFYL